MSFTYVIGPENPGADGLRLVKIGRSRDPEQRLSKLQTGNPVKLIVHMLFPDEGVTSESALHKTLEKHRVSGEWFRLGEGAWKYLEHFLATGNETGKLGVTPTARHTRQASGPAPVRKENRMSIMAASKNIVHTDADLYELDLNAPFQRDVVISHPIAKGGYDENIEGEIVVVVVNGTPYVVDGKQRVTQKRNALDAGSPVQRTIPAVVYYDETMEFAANKFVQVNKGRKALSSWDMFVAARASQDETALHVDRIAKAKGLPPARTGKTDKLTAINEAMGVVDRYGPKMLERVLDVQKALYPGFAPYTRFLEALANVLATDESPYKELLERGGDEYLIRRLQKVSGGSHKNLQAYITAKLSQDSEFEGAVNDSERTWRMGIYKILGKRYYKS